MDVGFLIQQYLNNLKEIMEQKLAEMEAFSDIQAAEIEALTNKLIALGIMTVVLIVVVVVLLIVLKSSKKKRKRKALKERESNLRWEEEQLRKERRRFEEEKRRQGYYEPDLSCMEQQREYPRQERTANEYPRQERGAQHESGKREYGTPSRRRYGGRQDDRAMKEEASRTTQYFGNDDWL